jgi:hypothetical protein
MTIDTAMLPVAALVTFLAAVGVGTLVQWWVGR